MKSIRIVLFALSSALALNALAQEATIRKNLGERLPNLPKIEEVSKTPMPGLYEVRINQNEIFYTDEKGDFLIQGSLIDTQARVDLTEQRVDKLSAIAFDDLPLKDSFTIVRGNGKRKLAVFEDPNCGYCKKFERDLLKVDNVTVYVFLYPILGADSVEKSKNIWCARDKGKTFLDWMLRNVTPPVAKCDIAAINRIVAFGRNKRINGTPALIFANGTRVPGAIGVDSIEKMLTTAQP